MRESEGSHSEPACRRLKNHLWYQHDRFIRERESVRRRRNRQPETEQSSKWPKWQKQEDRRSFFEKVQWMLEYHQRGLMQLIIIIVHILLLAYWTVKFYVYALLPHDRDPATKEFVQPILRFMESHYLVDCLNALGDKSDKFNKLGAVLFTQLLILRARSTYDRFRIAQLNRYEYIRIGIIQTDAFFSFHYETDLAGWLKLLTDSARHKCKIGLEPWRTRQMSDKLDGMDRIDQLFYYNLIDFDDCYQLKDMFVVYPEEGEDDDDKVSVALEDLNESAPTYSMKQWLKWTFTIMKPDFRVYTPTPMHRMDPRQFFFFFACYIFGFVTIIGVGTMNYTLAWWRNLRTIGLDLANFDQTFGVALENLTHNNIVMVTLGESLLALIIIGVNMFDCGFLFLSRAVVASRVSKVLKLLEREKKIYGFYLEESYCDYAVSNQQNMPPDSMLIESATCYNGHVKTTSGWRMSCSAGGLSPPSGSWLSDSNRQATFNSPDTINHHAGIAEMNENIRYLLRLVSILVSEFEVLKEELTFTVNLSVVLSTVCAAITFNLMAIISDLYEFLLAGAAILIIFGPLVIILDLGATAEGGFCQLCNLNMHLMINEAQIIDASNWKHLHDIHNHLKIIENRALILLGNMPVTYGSMIPVIGWMSTVSLVLQKFFTNS